MAKVRHSDTGSMPPRSESFLRMLELEKQYKMQRIQDNPPAVNSPSGSSSAPAQHSQPTTASTTASAPRARRGSAYPPLSHQDQILKAMTRSSTLPSLSISIPPSPVLDPLPKVNAPPEEPRPAKEERTKTVTFSDPDEDESNLSDQSSICQSPSWEGWNKRTKKSDKSDAKQPTKEDKTDKQSSKKRGNKLSKAPPQSPLPTSTARSASAPQLDNPKVDMAAATNAMQSVRHETAFYAQTSQTKTVPPTAEKSRSKKTLFGFKIQNGSSNGGKKPGDSSHDDAKQVQTGQDRSSSMLSMRKHQSLGPGMDRGSPAASNPADPTNRSNSSLDKRPPMVRPPSSSSNHIRSQSLLSSTLNKLRGPSYLYHRPQDKRNSNSHVLGSESPRPSVQSEDRPNSSGRPAPAASTATFTRKSKHKTTVSDTTSLYVNQLRGAQHLQSRSPNRGYDSPAPVETSPRHNQTISTQSHNNDSNLRRREEGDKGEAEPQRGRHLKEAHEGRHDNSRKSKTFAKNGTNETRPNRPNGERDRIQSTSETRDYDEHDSVSSSQDEGYTSAREHQSGRASPAHGRRRRQDSPVNTEKSTTTARTADRGKDSSPAIVPQSSKGQVILPNQSTAGNAVNSDNNVKAQLTQPNRLLKTEKPEQQKDDKIWKLAHPLRPKKSTDYFSFVNESYAPPSLELRSPLENLLQTLSQQTLIQAEVSQQAADVDGSQRPSSRQANRSTTPATPATPETRAETPRAKGGSGLVRGQEPRQSPATPTIIPDNEVPTFEPLTAPSKAPKTSNGSIVESASTRQSRQQEASRTASERSSSSTFGDAPPSPSSMTTPDSSRPHSHKSRPPSHLDLCRTVIPASASTSEEKTKPRAFPLSSRDRSSSRSRPTSKEAEKSDDSWSRSALPLDLENYSSVSLSGPDALASAPALISTPTSMTFADALKEEIAEELSSKSNLTDSLPPRAQSALDLPSGNFLPPLKHQSLNPKKNTSKLSGTVSTAPSSPLSEQPEESLRPALKKTRTSIGNSQDSNVIISTGAAYLQEARKSVSGASAPAASRTMRPQFTHRNTTIGSKGATTPGRAEPMAKMLVECCSCHFFHDMPARVYECMAKPDSVVEDKTLGVSAAITTMVKCPWCSHGMTTQCCSGYAAVVYLKEKLHGK